VVDLTYPLLANRVQDLSMEMFSSIGVTRDERNHSLQFGSTNDDHQIGV
jgi:hypothetical protein